MVRTLPINHRCRIAFETDVVNDCFDRPENKGVLELRILKGLESSSGITYSLNLRNGVAALNLKLPDRAKIGDTVKIEVSVSDDTLTEPFVNTFVVTVDKAQTGANGKTGGRKPPRSKEQGDDHDAPLGIQLPKIIPVTEAEWGKHGFDRCSAVKVAQDIPDNGNGEKPKIAYDFFVNVDNVHLQVEMKASRMDADILKARFTFGMVLVGLALIQDHQTTERQLEPDEHNGENDSADEESTIEDRVHQTTRAVAPMILPMIDSLGSLSDPLPVVARRLGYED